MRVCKVLAARIAGLSLGSTFVLGIIAGLVATGGRAVGLTLVIAICSVLPLAVLACSAAMSFGLDREAGEALPEDSNIRFAGASVLLLGSGAIVGVWIADLLGLAAIASAVFGVALGVTILGAAIMLTAGQGSINHRSRLARRLELQDEAVDLEEADHDTPPMLAGMLILLSVPVSDAVPMIGDLKEEFELVAAECGLRLARLWYWKQAFSSVPRNLKWRAARYVSALWALVTFRHWL